jgi:hypothetical protein
MQGRDLLADTFHQASRVPDRARRLLRRRVGRFAALSAAAVVCAAPGVILVHPSIARSTPDAANLTSCSPTANGDHVHVSTANASGHGWWVKENCTAAKASVSVTLWEEIAPGDWKNADTSNDIIKSGTGGSANRVTAKAECNNTESMTWHSQIVVAVESPNEGTDQRNTDNQILNCRV